MSAPPQRTTPPRRVCPACARRYAGLIESACVICQGLGVLALGAAALAHYEPAAVSRAVELYLEARAQRTQAELPLGHRPAALSAAVDELRLAGVLASTADAAGTPARTTGPPDAASARVTELDAYRAAHALGTPATPRVLNALRAPKVTDLTEARPRDGRIPTASRTGDRSALATIADPIDPLGPDTDAILAARVATGYRAKVIATAVPTVTRRRQKGTP